MSNKVQASEFFSKEFTERVIPLFLKSKLSNRTKKEYYRYTIHLCDFLQKDFLEITAEDVQTYFNCLKDREKPVTDKTVRLLKAAFITMEKYAKGKEWDTETSIFSSIKLNKTDDHINADRIPTVKEVGQLLETAKEDAKTHIALLLISRMAFSASRITSLKKSQLQMDRDGDLYISVTKRDKTTYLMAVPDDIKEELLRYCNSIDTEYLFANKKGKPLNRKTIYRIIDGCRIKAGIDTKCSAKDMRNRALLEQLHTGASREEVAEYTGISYRRVAVLEQNVPKLRLCPPEKVTTT